MTRKVIIVQRWLTHYRVPLFELLRNELESRQIQLELLIGEKCKSNEKEKCDSGELTWAKHIPTYYFIRDRLCWQPIHRYLKSANLVIMAQENALIANQILIYIPRNYKLAFWGHGANLQSSNPSGLKERYKRWTTNQVDWWFAYTQLSADLIENAGFPTDRITILNNVANTLELQRMRESIGANEMLALRHSLGFGDGPVGVFIGSLYPDKRLDFLFLAAESIRREINNFNLLIIGDGPEREKVQKWCETHSWTRWVGAKFGYEKVLHLSIAEVMLNPGLVGLGIMDAFMCKLPMLTTDCGIHSPEIVYLENGYNGLISSNEKDNYVMSCVNLLRNRSMLNHLRSGCAASVNKYRIEDMVQKFANGIETVLSIF